MQVLFAMFHSKSIERTNYNLPPKVSTRDGY